jgi:hypothetical protein
MISSSSINLKLIYINKYFILVHTPLNSVLINIMDKGVENGYPLLHNLSPSSCT